MAGGVDCSAGKQVIDDAGRGAADACNSCHCAGKHGEMVQPKPADRSMLPRHVACMHSRGQTPAAPKHSPGGLGLDRIKDTWQAGGLCQIAAGGRGPKPPLHRCDLRAAQEARQHLGQTRGAYLFSHQPPWPTCGGGELAKPAAHNCRDERDSRRVSRGHVEAAAPLMPAGRARVLPLPSPERAAGRCPARIPVPADT